VLDVAELGLVEKQRLALDDDLCRTRTALRGGAQEDVPQLVKRLELVSAFAHASSDGFANFGERVPRHRLFEQPMEALELRVGDRLLDAEEPILDRRVLEHDHREHLARPGGHEAQLEEPAALDG